MSSRGGFESLHGWLRLLVRRSQPCRLLGSIGMQGVDMIALG